MVDAAIAALAAEAVGAMSAMHELTVDYLKTRKQFGVPIGNFQVLQHRAGDMLIALEQARSMAMLATMMAEEPNAAERRKAITAAKVQIGRSARFVGQQAIQLHGGIGMTMEYKVGHYFKRVTMIDTMFGDADHHLAALARMGGIIGDAVARPEASAAQEYAMAIPTLPPPSAKAVELGERVKAFMEEHIIPAEPVYRRQLDEGADRWQCRRSWRS